MFHYYLDPHTLKVSLYNSDNALKFNTYAEAFMEMTLIKEERLKTDTYDLKLPNLNGQSTKQTKEPQI